MLILALDTSGTVASCALCRNGETVAYKERDSMLDHSSTLLPVCGEMMKECGVEMGQVDVFAATVGPGSFTGVRIGTAAVKGMAWTLNRPCAGVSTLLSAAYGCRLEGRFCQCIEAREDEVFFAVFERHGDKIERITEDAVAKKDEIEGMGLPVVYKGQSARGTALAAYDMAKSGQLLSCHDINPSYLRMTQAERMRKERENKR